MSVTVMPPGRRTPPTGLTLGQRRLPVWGPYTIAALAVAVGAFSVVALDVAIAGAVPLAVVVFGVVLTAVSLVVEGRRRATDRAVTTVVTSAFALAMVPLVSVLWTMIENGMHRLDGQFFTWSMRGVIGEGGGAYHALMGTLVVTLLATLISVPVGIFCAIYLVEYGRGRLMRAITFFVNVMTGIPSIVAGLFSVALFTLALGPGTRSGLAGAVALSVLMIPVVVRSTEEMLKLVPNELREASYALGVPKWRTIVKVVLPTALAGIATGVTIAIARIIGETAPLLVTVGITTSTNFNPFDGRMATLPVFAYYQVTQPGVPPAPAIERAWTAALVLVAIVMLLNISARVVARIFAPKTGR